MGHAGISMEDVCCGACRDRGDLGPLGHFLDFVKYLDSGKQDACITYHN